MGKKKFGSAVVLCGGKSSRMGYDKCNIRVGNNSLYQLIADQLADAFDEVILVINKGKILETTKYIIVEDIVTECGPIGGILTGLHYATSEYVFFIACDMPVVNHSVINYFKDKLKDGGGSGLVGMKASYIEPLYSFYSKLLEEEILRLISKGIYQISRLVMGEDFIKVPEEEWRAIQGPEGIELDVYSNVNYIEDLEMLKKLYENEVVFDGQNKTVEN